MIRAGWTSLAAAVINLLIAIGTRSGPFCRWRRPFRQAGTRIILSFRKIQCRVEISKALAIIENGDTMGIFQFENTSISGLTVISPFCAEDQRGMFMKSFEKEIFAAHGIELSPWEELRSRSRKGVLRGLHFQRRYCQDKLVQVLNGAVYDVAVDLREGSETFGKWEGFILTAENRRMLYIPKGFAHGFLALEDNVLFNYLCGDRYDPDTDGGIRWNDPQLAICWPVDQVENIILSDKDAALPSLEEFVSTHGPLRGA